MRTLVVAAVSLLAAGSAALATEAESNRIIFGREVGEGKAFACFHRTYDAAHLLTHPKQNVTGMLFLVSSTVDPESGRQYTARMGVTFRKASTQFHSGSGCVVSSDGKNALNCPIDCDGGEIDVRLRDASSLLVSIPGEVQIWNPNATEEDAEPYDAVHFGPDDKLFRLDRAATADCLPLVADDDEAKADLEAAQ
jgi:hypothetical protein